MRTTVSYCLSASLRAFSLKSISPFIAISVIFALLGSYIISHTLIAGFAGRFGAEGDASHWYQRGINFPIIASAFSKTLNIALKRPLLAGLLIGILPVSGFIASGQMTEQFFPPSDRDMFQIEVP